MMIQGEWGMMGRMKGRERNDDTGGGDIENNPYVENMKNWLNGTFQI